MTSSKNTKRALLASVLSVVLCCAMLVGSTFAWFTDSVTNTDNRIVAGNLDIDLLMDKEENGTYTSIAGGEGDIFNEAQIAQNSNKTLWEPGKTQIVYLGVQNKGSLALKYNILLDVTDNGLAGALEYAVLDGAQASDLADVTDWEALKAMEGAQTGDIAAGRTIAAPNGCLDEIANGTKDETDYFALAVHMKEDAGNEYQGKDITIDVTVVATQATAEEDGFGNDQYDKDATYPVIAYNQQQVNDAITNATDKKANISIASGETITLDNGIANEGDKSRDITFSGDGSQTVDVITNAVSAEGGQLNYQRGSSFTFENLTIQAGEGNFDGIVCDELTFKNCTIQGKLTLYGKATFINCVFENTMDNQYSIWTWGGTDVIFENCTFNTNGKAILLYGSANTNLVVNNCIFNDRKDGAAGKAAIEIGNDYNATYTLTVNNATVDGFAPGKNTNSTLWANKNSMDAAHLTVTIDGNKVQ